MFDHPVISAQWKHSTCAHWCEKEFELRYLSIFLPTREKKFSFPL
ncbi:hypothetical protein T12_8945 [Trichinella patagoniensis]|uniref:Uncharacterized protein n=1 Tax=Trichinella patagoniensis TaxID=990121 RepID=A0A0V1ADJ5_9BILA|nr:hypothetical protein T12_8945 [Trichinella patagoniensis]